MWPQAKSEVERQNSLLKAMRVAHSERRDWRKEMQKFLLGYRSTPHTTTGVSPAKLLFGREIRSKISAIHQLNRLVLTRLKAAANLHCQKMLAKVIYYCYKSSTMHFVLASFKEVF